MARAAGPGQAGLRHNAHVRKQGSHNAILHNAMLHNAMLHNAMLHNAMLHNAMLHNAMLHNAMLHNAMLHIARFLSNLTNPMPARLAVQDL